MRHWLVIAVGSIVLAAGMAAPAAAQEGTPAAEFVHWPAYSNEILPTFGYPELRLRETGSGLEGVPDEIAAGRYVVTVEAPVDSPAYVDVVQVPSGLTQTEAEEQLLTAARDDAPAPGWVFGGGSYALPGQSISFAVELQPGDWHVAATRESVPPAGGEVTEWATLHPLRVTAAAAMPGAATPASTESVALEMQDGGYGGLDAPIPAGPQVWQLGNTGSGPHHLLLYRTPRPVASADVEAWFTSLMSGTPPAEVAGFNEIAQVGYAALLSPGQTMWHEYDLEPGSYVVMSFIADPGTGMPAVLQGMVGNFTVE